MEGLVGYARRNFLVPVPTVDSLAELNERLLEACVQYGDHRIASRTESVQALFEQEKDHLLALPAIPFSNIRLLDGRVDRYGTVMADKNHYSVPSHYRGLKVRGEFHIDQLELFCEGKRIARHERVFGNNKEHDPQEVEAAVVLALEHNLSHSAGVKQLLSQVASEESFDPLDDWPVTMVPDVSVYAQLGGAV